MIDDVLVEFISNVGFPIGAFLLMWYQANTTIKNVRVSMDKLSDRISEACKILEEHDDRRK